MANTNDAKRAYRTALLAKSWGCDEATAARMTEPLAGLTDAEFASHAGFLAERRASIEHAKAGSVKPPQKAGPPSPVHEVEASPSREEVPADIKVSGEIQSYMADLFGVQEDEPDEDEER
jgi:hypothetical protein